MSQISRKAEANQKKKRQQKPMYVGAKQSRTRGERNETNSREKQAAREERPWPVLFLLPKAPAFGACILATMNWPILSYSHAAWPRWNQEEEHQLSSAWAPTGRGVGFSPQGRLRLHEETTAFLVAGGLDGESWGCSPGPHVPLGLHHICSELPSALATLALWAGPNGMQLRILTGNFLEDVSPSPACGLQVTQLWGVPLLLQNNRPILILWTL